MNSMTRNSWAMATALGLVFGCDTPADVLTTSFCPPTDLETWVANTKMGDACSASNGTGCGTLDATRDPASCESNKVDGRSCIEGHTNATTRVELYCGLSAAPDGGWLDCPTALANGKTGDGCAWQGVCSRATEDSCCIEMAACGSGSPGTLQRRRFCAPGCETIIANASHTMVTDCASAFAARDQFATPCEPGLVCLDGVTEADASSLSGSVQWCANDVLVGNGAL